MEAMPMMKKTLVTDVTKNVLHVTDHLTPIVSLAQKTPILNTANVKKNVPTLDIMKMMIHGNVQHVTQVVLLVSVEKTTVVLSVMITPTYMKTLVSTHAQQDITLTLPSECVLLVMTLVLNVPLTLKKHVYLAQKVTISGTVGV
jgi:chorismate mutase